MTIDKKLELKKDKTIRWAKNKDVRWKRTDPEDYKKTIELDCPVCKSVNIIEYIGRGWGVHECWNCGENINWGEPK
jgi:phage FluMu protein Com